MKMAEVMACVDRVAKNGTNAAQNYRYAMAADVYDAVRSELAKRFVIPIPNVLDSQFTEAPTKAGGIMRYCTLTVRYDFMDGESGEVISATVVSQGSDSGDKGVFKAQTGATKNCLVNVFLIPTGDDPEHEPRQSSAPPPAGAEALKARMKAPPRAANEPPPHGDDDAPQAAAQGVFPTTPPTHNRERTFYFGNAKYKPLHVMEPGDLKFYAGALTRDLASDDAKKQQYAEQNRAALADVVAEQKYRGL